MREKSGDFTAAKSKETIDGLSGSCIGQQQNQKSQKHAFPYLATVLDRGVLVGFEAGLTGAAVGWNVAPLNVGALVVCV